MRVANISPVPFLSFRASRTKEGMDTDRLAFSLFGSPTTFLFFTFCMARLMLNVPFSKLMSSQLRARISPSLNPQPIATAYKGYRRSLFTVSRKRRHSCGVKTLSSCPLGAWGHSKIGDVAAYYSPFKSMFQPSMNDGVEIARAEENIH